MLTRGKLQLYVGWYKMSNSGVATFYLVRSLKSYNVGFSHLAVCRAPKLRSMSMSLGVECWAYRALSVVWGFGSGWGPGLLTIFVLWSVYGGYDIWVES